MRKDDQIEWDFVPFQPDYKYWLDHERLTLIEISFIAAGREPVSTREFFNKPKSFFPRPYEIYHLLQSAVDAGKIKDVVENGNTYKAPTAEWLRYLSQKKVAMPKNLISSAKELIAQYNLETKPTRDKKSYLPKDTRDEDLALEAVMRTLLDLFPDMSKRDLIKLKPVRQYASGVHHPEDKLLKLITKIEGGTRKGGRPSHDKADKTKYQIPEFWRQ